MSPEDRAVMLHLARTAAGVATDFYSAAETLAPWDSKKAVFTDVAARQVEAASAAFAALQLDTTHDEEKMQ